ncbi:MAG: CHAT domain-containing protein [Bdellovibrionota bacterium]
MRRLHAIAVAGLFAAAGAACFNVVGYKRGDYVPTEEARAAFEASGKPTFIEKEFSAGQGKKAFYGSELAKTRFYVTRKLSDTRNGEAADPAYTNLRNDSYLARLKTALDEMRGRGEEVSVQRGLKVVPQNLADQARSGARFNDELFWKQMTLLDARLDGYKNLASYTALSYRAIYKDQYIINTTEDVRLTLSPGEALLEYHQGSDGIYGFLVTLEATYAEKLPVTTEELKRKISGENGLVALLSNPPSSGAQRGLKVKQASAEGPWVGPAKAVYDAAIAPFSKGLEEQKITALFIVPDGLLANIPFAALAGPDGKLLIEKYRLTYEPSFSIYKNILSRKLPKNPPSVLAVGAPPNSWFDQGGLPEAVREAGTVSRIFEGGRLFAGQGGTESAFYRDVPNYSILHLATHGLAHKQPRKSFLQFGDDGSNDGLLTAAEISALDLSHLYVAVLSACQTAVSADADSTGELVSLTTSFLEAGAPTVVGSFWQVSDVSTTRLMLNFYEKFLEVGTSEALRQAQLALRTDSSYSHPYYWAAFGLYGFDK